MGLLERIRKVDEPFLQLLDEPEHCMYCGDENCPHGREWLSRAWASRAATLAVLPAYEQSPWTREPVYTLDLTNRL